MKHIALLLLLISSASAAARITPGAERTKEYLPLLAGKKAGIVANQTSLIGPRSTVDSLLALGVELRRILVPEHGFRGDEQAGETIADDRDKATGLPVISIYRSGSRTHLNKPTPEDLAGLDVLLFDLQDVGVRFYTTISTLHYVMEACAENGVPLMLLDRPNPHGNTVDGPVLDTAFRSFVGMHPVPAVYGMTIGEYARMINGERWLRNGVRCDLRVIPCAGYTHDSLYQLPAAPSPNLPDMRSVSLYPSICFFEGTVLSLGRGTPHPFQMFGHPSYAGMPFAFTPRSVKAARTPPLQDRECRGMDLRSYDVRPLMAARRLRLQWLIDAYEAFPVKDSFFIPYINTLAGSTRLRDQIRAGRTEEEIRRSWDAELAAFHPIRQKYLLYPDVRRTN